MYPLVSILIPTYNREGIIEETISSAIAQDYPNIEFVVVDNASTDNTWDVVTRLSQQDNRIKCFRNERNLGPVRNWKKCIGEASGEYGKILWSDDLIAPSFVSKTMPFIVDDESVAFVYSGVEIFSENSNKKQSCYFINETGKYPSFEFIDGLILSDMTLSNRYPVSPGCSIFRMKDLEKNLLIDVPNKVGSDFSMHAIGNDALLFLLTANQYDNYGFINEKLSFFRSHLGSISVESAKTGKLILMYDLAKSFFVENYRQEIAGKHNANVSLHLKDYSYAKSIGLKGLKDFYFEKNCAYSIDYKYMFKQYLKAVFKKINIFRFLA